MSLDMEYAVLLPSHPVKEGLGGDIETLAIRR